MENRVVKFLNKKVNLRNSTFFHLLVSVYGLNQTSARFLLDLTGVSYKTQISSLGFQEVAKFERLVLRFFVVERTLKKSLILSVETTKGVGSLRAIRHVQQLPVRGQRTHSNSKTVRRVLYSL